MLAFISRLVLQLAAVRWLFKLGGLALFLPIALLLKAIGLPLLIVMMIVGAPVLILLLLFGLPIFAVVALGGVLIGLMATVLMVGLAALKFAVVVVLPVWLMWKIGCWLWRATFGRDRGGDRGGDGGSPPATTTEPVEPIDPGTPPDVSADPVI
jgi:hypothetical protein